MYITTVYTLKMDLKQRKLTKSEWDGIEIPVHKNELEVLRLIVNGFSNVHLNNSFKKAAGVSPGRFFSSIHPDYLPFPD